MSELTDDDRKALLTLARSAIESALVKGAEVRRPEKMTPALKENRGCFVTLHKDGDLRGCIGTIEPERPLAEAVEENALNSAFRDPRFSPLYAEELSRTEIEISVLTVPKNLPFKNGEDLKNKLKPGIHGVILSKGWQRSTFLPQVWEQLSDVEAFLVHLCLKGGMGADCWKSPETRVQVYQAEYFSEATFQV